MSKLRTLMYILIAIVALYVLFIIFIDQPSKMSECLGSFDTINITDAHRARCAEITKTFPTIDDLKLTAQSIGVLFIEIFTKPPTWLAIGAVVGIILFIMWWRRRNPSARRSKDEEFRQNYMFIEAYINPNPLHEGDKTRIYVIGSDDHTLEILPEKKKNKPYTRDDFFEERGHEITWLGRKVLPRKDSEWQLIESAKKKLLEKHRKTQDEKVFLKIRFENVKSVEWIAFKPTSDIEKEFARIGRKRFEQPEFNVHLGQNEGGK